MVAIHVLKFNRLDIDNVNSIPFDNGVVNFQNRGYIKQNDIKSYLTQEFKQNFNAMHINCRSLGRNFDEILTLIHPFDSQLSVIALTETWLSDDVTQLYNIPGYNFLSNCRHNKTGGGVGFYINDSIDYKLLSTCSYMYDFIETIFIEVTLPSNAKCLIGCVYRPPNSDLTGFHAKCEEILTGFANYKHKILLGDFNLDLIKFNSHQPTTDFIELMYSNGFQPLINLPTRITEQSATCIDNIFLHTHNKVLYDISSYIIVTDISDHYPVLLTLKPIKTHNSNPQPCNEEMKTKTKFNLMQCSEILQSMDWSAFKRDCETNSDINSIYHSFASIVDSAISSSTSISTVAPRKFSKHPWITSGLLSSSDEKHRLYNNYVKNPTPENKLRYVSFRNKFKSVLKLSKKNFFSNKFQEASNNVKETWKVLNMLLNKANNTSIIKEVIQNGTSYTTPLDIANKLNEYFINIGRNIQASIKTNISYTTYLKKIKSPPQSFALWDATREEVINILKNLKPKQSRGHDGLSMKMLKSLADILSGPLCDIFNSILRLAVFPDELKTAKVIALFKTGAKTDVTNYRPISLLPSSSKVFERLLHSRLYNYLNKYELLIPNQYGFRHNHSTTLAVLDIQDKVTSALENRQSSVGIFLDLSKAFDSIDHSILIDKLNHYGIRGHALELFKSYLTNRKQFVVMQNQRSNLEDIHYGVPQGSILGPLLFILYINDITTASDHFQYILFADDTNLFLTHKDNDQLFTIANAELKVIYQWFKSNKLLLNGKKSSFIHFSYNNSESKPLFIDNDKINEVNDTKFLGVMIDKELKWGPHISNLCKKLSKSVGIITRLRNELDSQTMLTLYFSLIYTHLTYCNIVWGSADNKHINKVSVLQNRFFRLLKHTTNNSHIKTTLIYKQHDCLKLKDIHKLNSCLFMFKLKYNLLPPSCNKYLVTYNNHNTRSMPRSINNFTHGIARLKVTNNYIKFLGPRIWSEIPNQFKSLIKISTFKLSLKKWFIDRYDLQ